MSIEERQQAFKKALESLVQQYGVTVTAVLVPEQLNNSVVQARAQLAFAQLEDWKENVVSAEPGPAV